MGNAQSESASIDSPVYREIKKSLECPVCLLEYNVPKSTPCGHSVCATCEARLVINGLWIKCPVCRATVGVPTGGLPTNYILVELLSQFQKQKEKLPTRHVCSDCGERKLIAEFFLCQPQPDQQGEPRVACSICALTVHKNARKTQIAELFFKRKALAADFVPKTADKLKEMTVFAPPQPRNSTWPQDTGRAIALLLTGMTNELLKIQKRLDKNRKQLQDKINGMKLTRTKADTDESRMVELLDAKLSSAVLNMNVEQVEKGLGDQIARQRQLCTDAEATKTLVNNIVTQLSDHLKKLKADDHASDLNQLFASDPKQSSATTTGVVDDETSNVTTAKKTTTGAKGKRTVQDSTKPVEQAVDKPQLARRSCRAPKTRKPAKVKLKRKPKQHNTRQSTGASGGAKKRLPSTSAVDSEDDMPLKKGKMVSSDDSDSEDSSLDLSEESESESEKSELSSEDDE